MIEKFCNQLKERRKELGFSLEDVVDKTKLYPSAIRDLEAGNFGNISPAYLRGFIRIYASFLGVDSAEILAELSSEKITGKTSSPVKKVEEKKENISSLPPRFSQPLRPMPAPVARPLPQPPVQPPKPPKPSRPASVPSNVDWAPFRNFITVVVLGIIFFIGVAAFGRFIIKKIPQKKPSDKVVAEAKVKKNKVPKNAVKKEPRKEIKKPDEDNAKKNLPPVEDKKPKPVLKNPLPAGSVLKTANMAVSITAKKKCFVKVKSDGKVLFEGILKKGIVESWKGRKEIEFKISDGSAVYIELNGKPLPLLTSMHRPIKKLRITPAGISVDK